MNDKLSNVLAELAQKMGTSVEHLWGVMVSAQRAVGAVDLLIAALCAVVVVIGIKAVRFAMKDESYSDEWATVIGIIGGVAGFIAAIAFMCFIYDALIELTLPEYAALKAILGLARPR